MKLYRANLGTRVTATVCAALLIPSSVFSAALRASTSAGRGDNDVSRRRKFPMTSSTRWSRPIALYPDPLLAQVLAASTYPLEIVQLQQWMAKHPDLKGEALAAAVEKEDLGSGRSRPRRRCPTSSSASATTSSGRPISAMPSSRSRAT